MVNFGLPIELEQQIVDGIRKGEQQYLQMRLRENPRLKVSNGLSWARGNYIDTYVGETVEKNPNMDYKVGKAGYTWEYLQFAYTKSESQKSLIFVKSIRTIEPQFNGSKNQISDYMDDYAGINNFWVNNGELKGIGTGQPFQLELMPNTEKLDSKSFQRFYIVTYDHDENGLLSKVVLTMPNQQTHKLFQVEDLTSLMDSSNIEFTEDEMEIASGSNSNVPDAAYGSGEYGYEIAEPETKLSDTEK